MKPLVQRTVVIAGVAIVAWLGYLHFTGHRLDDAGNTLKQPLVLGAFIGGAALLAFLTV